MCSKKLFVNLLVIELMFYSFFDLVFYSFLCFCVDWLVDRRTDRWADWLTDWPTDRPTDQPTNRPIDRPTGRPSDRLTDWLTDGRTDWLTGYFDRIGHVWYIKYCNVDKLLYLVLFSLNPKLFWELRDKRNFENYLQFTRKPLSLVRIFIYRTWPIIDWLYSIDWFAFAERDVCVPGKQLTIQKHQKVVGVAIYFFTYSTWEGPVLYVEDLFVIPAVRGKHS